MLPRAKLAFDRLALEAGDPAKQAAVDVLANPAIPDPAAPCLGDLVNPEGERLPPAERPLSPAPSRTKDRTAFPRVG